MNLDYLIRTMQDAGTNFGFRILSVLLIYIAGKIVKKVVSSGITKVLKTKNVDETISRFVIHLVGMSITVFVFIAIMAQLGIQTASFIAIIGAASFAVGLALQGALSNFAAGVLLMLFRPFKIGDIINVAGKTGKVSAISVLVTELITPDNKKIILPNSKVMSDTISNFTALGEMRVDLVIGVGYGDDLDHVKKTLADELSKNEMILAEPPVQIAVESLGDSCVNFAVRPWCKSENYWSVKFDLLEAIKKRFDKENINIPYPQQDVHIISQPKAK
jgi:small conductance mechanosensitive channel